MKNINRLSHPNDVECVDKLLVGLFNNALLTAHII